MMGRFIAALGFGLFGFLFPCVSWAETPVQATRGPGDFDFYVLSLSWSPSYCAAVGDKRQLAECAKPFGFVMHGLWPQFELGYPSNCAAAGSRLPAKLVQNQLDLFPGPGLAVHEWKTHGSCSGLEPSAYFDAARKAFSAITLPSAYSKVATPEFAAPADIAKDFISANKGLVETEIAVICNKQRFNEVRICLNKDLNGFRPCPQIVAASCKQEKTFLPAIHAAN